MVKSFFLRTLDLGMGTFADSRRSISRREKSQRVSATMERMYQSLTQVKILAGRQTARQPAQTMA